MNYRINKAEYTTDSHSTVLVSVSEISDNGTVIDTYLYGVSEKDDAPINKILLAKLKENPDIITESTLLQIRKGTKPVPKDYVLVNGGLFRKEDFTSIVVSLVNQQLDSLYSGHVIAKAERDKEFAEKREHLISKILDLQNQPGFPHDIDYDEFIEDFYTMAFLE